MKIYNSAVVFREIPDEVTLALNISECPHRCPGCHSPELQSDNGVDITYQLLDGLIHDNEGITCVGFMGGDRDVTMLQKLAIHIHEEFNLKVAWYTGSEYIPWRSLQFFDYVKFGPYKADRGPLNCKTTNQVLLKIDNGLLYNITENMQQ
jgi:anaerobic ribonucleoside-triphosphate reductase activating protein